MTELLRSFSQVMNLWPETDYEAYIPSSYPSTEAWENVGNNIAKAIVVEAIRVNSNECDIAKLDLALSELEHKDAHKFENKIPY